MFGGMSGDNVAAAYGTAAAAAAAGFWSTTNCMKCSQPFETTQALSKHLNLVHSGSAPCNIVSQAGGGGSDTAVVQCQECTLYHCRAGDCKDVFYETSLALKQHHKLVHGFNHNGGSNTTSNSSSNKASAGSSRPSSATAAPTTSATTTSSSSPPEGEYEIRPGVVIHPYIMDSNNGKLLGSENPKEDTPVGSPVFIFGLMSESGSRLNGKSGILCGYKTDKQRFIINVDGEKDVVLVKAKNLVLLK